MTRPRGHPPLPLQPGTGCRVGLVTRPSARPWVPVPLRRRLRRRARRMLHAVGLHAVELSVLLADDDEMAGLNETYRQKAGPTDVLSFALTEGPAQIARWCRPVDPTESGGERILGDVVIDVPLVARRSPPPEPFEADLVDLLAHGILHLLGHDHPTPTRRRAMLARQAALVAESLGRGPVRPVSGAQPSPRTVDSADP